MEMSLPEGQVRDLLFDVAIESGDSSMRNLFYLDRQDRMMDVGFIDIYTKGIRACSGRSTAVSRRDRTVRSWLVGGMMISCHSNPAYMRR